MGIRLKQLPEYRLELYIYSGAVGVEEVLGHYRRLDPDATWLSYFDATADLSGIDLADFPTLKRAITAKEDERKGGMPRRHALVNTAPSNAPFAQFWLSYAPAGVRYAHERDLFSTVEGACRWLALPPDGCQAITAALADA